MAKKMGMCNSIIKQLRIITLFAIIMLFSSCELFQIPIIGTFIYKDISTIQRKSASATPIWESEAQSNQHISYSISPSTEGISINSKSGIITVSDSAQIMDANFIIRAEAINNYKGGRNASIRVVVAKEYTLTGSFSYDNIIITDTSTPVTIFPAWQDRFDESQTVDYAINTDLPTGLALDTATGEIRGKPTVLQASTEYTITAKAIAPYTDPEPKITATVFITITTPITGNFSYKNTTINATAGTPITEDQNLPQWTGAAAAQTVQYSASNLPADLSIDATSGEISGTPQTALASTECIITATGTGSYTGSKTTTISISITSSAIGTISYTRNSIQGTKDTTITDNLIQWSDDAPSDITATYTIAPTFADTLGLTFNTADGTISGTPTVLQTSKSYTITAHPKPPYTGSTSTTIQIEITTPITGSFSYNNISATKDIALADNTNLPQWTVEGQPVSYSALDLPEGLNIDTNTGAISGTPTVLQTSKSYTITTTASAPYTDPAQPITATVQIAITTPLTGTFSYTNITATKDTTINTNLPTWKDAAEGQLDANKIAYSIATTDTPLPAGLSIDATTGEISGTPTVLQTSKSYTITATAIAPYTDPAQPITATVQITITTPLTGTFSYTNITATKDTTINANLPTWTVEGQTVQYSASNLPTGLSINTTTGAISGSHNAPLANFNCAITATGISPYTSSKTATVQITITTPLTGTFSYTNIDGVKNNSITNRSPNWKDSTTTSQTVRYAINTTQATDTLAFNATGLDFDAATGIISGTPTVPLASSNYTITATASAPYTDPDPKITATVQITITTPITGTFDYTSNTISAIQNTSITAVSPTKWSAVSDSNQTIEYVIRPGLPEGLLFDPSSGEISGMPTEPIASSEREYSVEARGISPYTGTISATDPIKITLTPLVKYSSIGSDTKATIQPVFYGDKPQTSLSYVIAAASQGTSLTIVPEINSSSGIITMNENTTAGTYVVTITDTDGYNQKAYFYVTTSPTSSTQLIDAIAAGIRHFGNTADLNYIQLNNQESLTAAFQNKATFNGDISKWDTSRITDMSKMFMGATAFNGDISAWDTSSVSHMSYMFEDATAFNGDISKWDTSNVAHIWSMFNGATVFNADISAWNVSSATSMTAMFQNATAFNSDISAWNVSNVGSMSGMFSSATAFNGDISAWNVSSATSMSEMFSGATLFAQNLDAWAPKLQSNVDISNMFDSSGLAGSEPCWYSSTGIKDC